MERNSCTILKQFDSNHFARRELMSHKVQEFIRLVQLIYCQPAFNLIQSQPILESQSFLIEYILYIELRENAL